MRGISRAGSRLPLFPCGARLTLSPPAILIALMPTCPDISTALCGVRLSSPVIPASGTFGFGYEFAELYNLNTLGSISIKGTTREARFGNPTPRIAETPAGMLNAVGLQNPGVREVIARELPRLREVYRGPIMANVCGFSPEEYATVAAAFDRAEGVAFLEVNISCPNVHGGGMALGVCPSDAAAVTRAVKDATTKPVLVKLSPAAPDIAEIARAVEAAGADAVSLINTLPGMRIDLKRRAPLLASGRGGLSGPALLPIALRMVYDVFEAVRIPVVGMGGVSTARDVIEMMMAGACAVEVGAANLIEPLACKHIVKDLPGEMESLGIASLRDIIGAAHRRD